MIGHTSIDPERAPRDFRRHRDGLIQITGLHQIKAAQLLFRFGEWSVCRQRPALAHANSSGGASRLQRVPSFNRLRMLAKTIAACLKCMPPSGD